MAGEGAGHGARGGRDPLSQHSYSLAAVILPPPAMGQAPLSRKLSRNLFLHFPLYLVEAVSLPAAAARRKEESAGEIRATPETN